jgi:hypothetical protein
LANWERSVPERSASGRRRTSLGTRRRAEAAAFRDEGAELSGASRRSTVKDTV